MTEAAYVPDAGDLIWTEFDPTRGREQSGRRPALVVSPAAFTHNTGLAVVCPITSRIRPFPTSVVLPSSLPVSGEVLVSHIRSIDTIWGMVVIRSNAGASWNLDCTVVE